jgi:hypothetical protein
MNELRLPAVCFRCRRQLRWQYGVYAGFRYALMTAGVVVLSILLSAYFAL